MVVLLFGTIVAGAGVAHDRQQYTSLCDAQDHPNVEYVFQVAEDGDIGVLREDMGVMVYYESFPASVGHGSAQDDWYFSEVRGHYRLYDAGDGHIINRTSDRIVSWNESRNISLEIRDCDS